MSRRRNPSVHFAFAKARLVCPDDHVVGYVVRQRWQSGPIGVTFLLDPDGRKARELNLAGKLKFPCERCRAAGKHPDLQASAERLGELLDTTRGTIDYRIG